MLGRLPLSAGADRRVPLRSLYSVTTLFVLLSPCLYLAWQYTLLSRLSQSLGEDITKQCLILPVRLVVKMFVWVDVFVFFLQVSYWDVLLCLTTC